MPISLNEDTRIIVFVIDRPKVQLAFETSEATFYLADGIIYLPYGALFFSLQVGSDKVNAQMFFVLLIAIFFYELNLPGYFIFGFYI
jgi:hypothetical protein